MNYLWRIIEKEFLSNLLTHRFLIGFFVCLLSVSITVYVQVDDYEKRLRAYTTAVKEHQAQIKSWRLYCEINPKVDRKPNQLSIFNQGVDKSAGDTVSIDLTEIPWDRLTQKMGADNPFIGIFLSIDVVFVFQMVLSLLALLFSYDAISGEKENGTLSLIVANAIPRGVILLGKYLGGLLSLLPTLMISWLVAWLIVLFSPALAFDGTEMLRIALILGVSLLYVSCCYLLGLFLSTRTARPATTLILAMFIWVNLLFVYPKMVPVVIGQLAPYKFDQGVGQKVVQIWNEFSRERDNYVKARGHRDATDGIIAGSRGVASRSGFGFKEIYMFSNISETSDFSFFHEFLAYQEPLRIRYADKVGQLFKGNEEVVKNNGRFVRNFMRLSFAASYDDLAAILAGTDSECYYDFIEQTRRYRHEIVQYLLDKKAFSSRQWYDASKSKADFTGMPVFRQHGEEMQKSLQRALSEILILFGWNILLFMGAHLSFLRYDVR